MCVSEDYGGLYIQGARGGQARWIVAVDPAVCFRMQRTKTNTRSNAAALCTSIYIPERVPIDFKEKTHTTGTRLTLLPCTRYVLVRTIRNEKIPTTLPQNSSSKQGERGPPTKPSPNVETRTGRTYQSGTQKDQTRRDFTSMKIVIVATVILK